MCYYFLLVQLTERAIWFIAWPDRGSCWKRNTLITYLLDWDIFYQICCKIDHHLDKVGVMMLNATCNTISVISRRLAKLVEETVENHWSGARHWKALLHNVVSSTPRHERDSNSKHLLIQSWNTNKCYQHKYRSSHFK